MTLTGIRAEAPVYGGYVIGRDGKIVFIRGAIPGELVEVDIEDRKKDYWTASVRNVLEPSEDRREPPCPLFGRCGGCQLQFASHARQVAVKEAVVSDTLRRIAGIEVPLGPSLVDREFHYRYRGQFKVSPAGRIGFFREGTREVIPVETCPIMTDGINGVLHRLHGADLRGVREVHAIAGDTTAVLLRGSAHRETPERLLESGVGGVAFENGESLGKDYVTLDLNGLRYTVTPWSFFQGHWSLNRLVVEVVAQRIAPLQGARVLDLYAGAGNFSLPLSRAAAEVVAVEESPAASDDCIRNVQLNSIRNCTVVRMTVDEALGGAKRRKVARLFDEARYDVVVVDPPRPGLSGSSVEHILGLGAGCIVYLSCNPATFARDVRKMDGQYAVESLCLVDFFPNTYHVETLAVLRRR